ncbi:long-chain-fatty-acid--CoA ligase [Rhodococcus sp. C3V]|uniref:long-chain-fatty-acid--CoA ligase n=1 Tax=Rhodococcus sp. C3V TaxID=3034165 RepID=UPI0023E26E8F|nr:long-chain-fatty-acid--CoA ligase [Rhodococcus sp. C3V]MDF3319944.1 long-chain-fatty-acid--CoA ligase [Rhodococcus sp. C3V]
MLTGIRSTMGDGYPLNVTSLLKRAARVFPSTEIVHRRLDGSWQRTDYAGTMGRVSQLAHALDELGIGPGTMVGVLDWNHLRHLELYFGVPGVGATMLQMNLRLAPADLAYVVEHSEAQWIFVDESLLPIAEQLADKIQVRGWVVMTDKPSTEITTSLSNMYFYEDLLAGKPERYDWQLVDESTACYVGYTTGTTGQPKGVYYSHRAIYLHTLGVISALKIDYLDCVMPVTPMFHVLSWGFPQAAVGAGAKVVLPGKFAAEDIESVADALIGEGVTVANGAPSIFTPILEHIRSLPSAPDLSRARFVSGSTEPPQSLMMGLSELTGAQVIHAYGASETSPVAVLNWQLKPDLNSLSDEQKWDLKRYQGLPLLGVEIEIVDDSDGRELPWDGTSVGEVQLRGPWITTSYHNISDNAERFSDGRWRSGDVGVITSEGYLKLTDRLKDVIKSGGEWISSIDMENAILDHPQVREAAVIGVPDPKFQERPVAYVVPRDGIELKRADIIEVLKDRFAKWQLPDKVVLIDEMPRTSVGKLDKKILRSQWSS